MDKSLDIELVHSGYYHTLRLKMCTPTITNGNRGRASSNDNKYKYLQKDEETQSKENARNREMTSIQELWNAITMIPYPLFFILMIVTGSWLSEDDIHSMQQVMISDQSSVAFNMTQHIVMPVFEDTTCIQSVLFPRFHALPPAPVLFAALGTIAHTPCSILYHILCAWYIPSGPKRIDHWSRRLDQAMIHFISTCWCYASSANWKYSICALVFNIYSATQLFSKKPHKSNQVIGRMGFGFLLPLFPFLVRGEILFVAQLMCIYGLSFWLFVKYPLGGWSHGLFHLVCAFAIPVMVNGALSLVESQDQIEHAAFCTVLSQMT